jgi:hypothetical protein
LPEILLSPEQNYILQPASDFVFIEGVAGSGKTTAAVQRLLTLIQTGTPAESILILLPQRTLSFPYENILNLSGLPPGGSPTIVTMDGLARRMISLFWPLIAQQGGFSSKVSPIFLTLETSQYYLNKIVEPLITKGYFETIRVEKNRLLSQIIDSVNKSAIVGFPYSEISERLKNAWVGKPEQFVIYNQVQECVNLFRAYCIENQFLDFSLQIELFSRYLLPSFIFREYLFRNYRHLIFDNSEEDTPFVHDIIRSWLPKFESGLIIFDTNAGYRSFLGADPHSAYSLKEECGESVVFNSSFVGKHELDLFQKILENSIRRHPFAGQEPSIHQAFSLNIQKFYPQMIDWVVNKIARLVIEERVPPGDIAVLSPFLSDTLRFSLVNRLEKIQVPFYTHRPSRSLHDEPASQSLLTLASLAHPTWEIACSHFDVRNLILQLVSGIDLTRAELLTKIIYRPRRLDTKLGSFDEIQGEMQERISFAFGEKYEMLRNWIMDYQKGDPLDLDIFLGKVFGEVLSQPGFGFYGNYESAAVVTRLIESIQKFRSGVGKVLEEEKTPLGMAYVKMLQDGIISAQYLSGWEEQPLDSIFIAPAYTFLMANRPVSYQFWLDIGSLGWWERLDQPLTHPYVLSRFWPPNTKWTDTDEYRFNQETISKLTSGLIRRCREHIFLCVSSVNEQGGEQRGPLLQATQTLLKKLPPVSEEDHV